MHKKLTAKVQKISSIKPDFSNSFSDFITITPEDNDVILKKGQIYSVFSLESTINFDTKLTTKIAGDILNQSYYQSENISPIQSLEKALLDVKDGITKLHIETGKSPDSKIELNMVSAVLWGNVLYIVEFGSCNTFLIRNSEIKPVNTITEGSFSSASCVIRDDDVLAIATSAFIKQFPPEKLITSITMPTELPGNASCMILKFFIDSTFSESELIDFVQTKPVQKSSFFSSIKESIRLNKLTKKLKLRDIKIKTPAGKKFVFTPIMGIPIILILLAISIFVTLKNRNMETSKKGDDVKGSSTVVQNKDQENQENTPEQQDTNTDSETKTFRAQDAPIYDLKIAEAEAKPSEIAVMDNSIIVSEKSTGKIYTSDVNNIKFEPSSTQFPNINSLAYDGGKLSFSDSEGYKTLDTTSQKVVQNFTQAGLTKTATYLDFIYSLEGDKVVKYTKDSDKLASATWAQNEDFVNARSISVAVSVYVLKEDGSLVKYTRGTKDSFEIKNLNTPLNDGVQIVANYNFKNIYIADKSNNRVLIIDETGNLIKQVKYKNDKAWSEITGIAVSPKEDTLYVLNGTLIYKYSL